MKINSVWLVLNYNCNNKCVWCYAKEGSEKFESFIPPIEEAKKRVDLISGINAKTIILIGGEPTLYPYLEELIKYIKSKGLKTNLVTNGKRLANKEFLIGLINAGLDRINISIEAPTSEEHDRITQVEGSFSETLRGIRNCLKEKISFTTLTTISKVNKKNLRRIIDLLKEEGLKRIAFNICGPSIGLKNNNPIYSPDFREAVETIEELYVYSTSKDMKIRITTSVPKCLFKKSILGKMLKDHSISETRNCIVYTGSGFAIDLNGDVLPCTHWISLPLMNIYKDKEMITVEDFKKEWEEGKPKRFREKMARYPTKKCSRCSMWGYNCIGGCPLFWTLYDPKTVIEGS